MQNAKDSFYIALRDRLATLNPSRTVLIRGTVRPGILVEEAEAPYAQLPNDVYILRWSTAGLDAKLPISMVAQNCDILYQTCGTEAYGGLDRGRALSTMDSEVASLLLPNTTKKYNYLTTAPTAMLSSVFWDDPVYGPLTTQKDRISRTVSVLVYSYQEEGE